MYEVSNNCTSLSSLRRCRSVTRHFRIHANVLKYSHKRAWSGIHSAPERWNFVNTNVFFSRIYTSCRKAEPRIHSAQNRRKFITKHTRTLVVVRNHTRVEFIHNLPSSHHIWFSRFQAARNSCYEKRWLHRRYAHLIRVQYAQDING